MPDEIDVLRALAHPVRWGILERLAAEPGICACSFTEFFDVSQPTISAHLKALRQAGLVTTQRRGTEIWYSLARDQLTPLAGRLAGMASTAAPVVRHRGTRPWFRRPWFLWPFPAPGRRPRPRCPAASPTWWRRPRRGSRAVSPSCLTRRWRSVRPAASRPRRPQPRPPQRRRAGPALAGRLRAGLPGGKPSRGLADMAAMAQAAVPRPAGRRGRTAAPPTRLHGGRAAVPAQAGSAED